MTTHPKRSWLTRALVFVATLSLVASQYGSPAQAANGDQLRQINADSSGTLCADDSPIFHVGVGIAFLYFGGLSLWPGVLIGDLLVNDYSTLPVGSAIGQS